MAVRHHIKVMVVDDEEAVCKTVSTILEGRGYKIWSYRDAETALEAAADQLFDVGLIDIHLPGASGVELMDHLREMGARPSMIVMTAYPDVESAAETMRSGSRDYLVKPFRADQLIAAVERVCREMGLVYTTEQELNRLIGQRIRRQRQTLSLTLRDLADRTELTTSQLSQVELGKNAASLWALARISNALGHQLSELLRGL